MPSTGSGQSTMRCRPSSPAGRTWREQLLSMPDDRPVAVVTGANRGIGHEVCRQLAARGYVVVLGSRDAEKGARAASALGVRHCQLDVAEAESVHTAAAWVTDRLGRCDALINNAAILYVHLGARKQCRPPGGEGGARDEPARCLACHARVSAASAPIRARQDRERVERGRLAGRDVGRYPGVQRQQGGAQCPYSSACRRAARRPHPRQCGLPRLDRHGHGRSRRPTRDGRGRLGGVGGDPFR